MTYLQTKKDFGAELSVTSHLSRIQRSLVAPLRSGIFALAIEVSRFTNISEENRLCEHCDLDKV